ncbi:MAG: DUF5666 domain-containing protein [Nitrospirota bacterium]|nr:DUF5666 domain-containing protein [Nitrospirota bacterium]
MKKVFAMLIIALLAGMSMDVAYASERGRTHEDERRHSESDVKIYGNVDKMPEGGIGIWVIKGKEILVTKETIIKEKHGKASVGSYVEVEGTYRGNTVHAYELEVKRKGK